MGWENTDIGWHEGGRGLKNCDISSSVFENSAFFWFLKVFRNINDDWFWKTYKKGNDFNLICMLKWGSIAYIMESQKRECLGYIVKLENVGVLFSEELLKCRCCGHWGEGTKNLWKSADVLYEWSLRTFEDGGVFTLETYIP